LVKRIDNEKAPAGRSSSYSIQQIILLTGCSSAAPVSSSDLHVKVKKTGPRFAKSFLKYNFMQSFSLRELPLLHISS